LRERRRRRRKVYSKLTQWERERESLLGESVGPSPCVSWLPEQRGPLECAKRVYKREGGCKKGRESRSGAAKSAGGGGGGGEGRERALLGSNVHNEGVQGAAALQVLLRRRRGRRRRRRRRVY